MDKWKQEIVNHCGSTVTLVSISRCGYGYLHFAQPNDSQRCLRNTKARGVNHCRSTSTMPLPIRWGHHHIALRASQHQWVPLAKCWNKKGQPIAGWPLQCNFLSNAGMIACIPRSQTTVVTACEVSVHFCNVISHRVDIITCYSRSQMRCLRNKSQPIADRLQ